MGSAALKLQPPRTTFRPLSEFKLLDDGSLVAEYIAGQHRAFD